jgi:hypothetical protein
VENRLPAIKKFSATLQAFPATLSRAPPRLLARRVARPSVYRLVAASAMRPKRPTEGGKRKRVLRILCGPELSLVRQEGRASNTPAETSRKARATSWSATTARNDLGVAHSPWLPESKQAAMASAIGRGTPSHTLPASHLTGQSQPARPRKLRQPRAKSSVRGTVR